MRPALTYVKAGGGDERDKGSPQEADDDRTIDV
jgi:hypothetical protein